MKVLVTGAAGFIGYHVCQRLAESQGCEVLGVDSLNDYYSVDLKRARLAQLEGNENFRFVQADFADAEAFNGIYNHFKPDYVVHLGAQANVRYSVDNPGAYVQSNLVGFFNVLEAARANPPKHLVFASSSSVYGATAQTPFTEDGDTSHPLSFYGATKKAGEVMADYAFSTFMDRGAALTPPRLFSPRRLRKGARSIYLPKENSAETSLISMILWMVCSKPSSIPRLNRRCRRFAF